MVRIGLLIVLFAATPVGAAGVRQGPDQPGTPETPEVIEAPAAPDEIEAPYAPLSPEDAIFGVVGPNDLRVSDMGPNGNTAYAALAPEVAYNSIDNQYLVVWYGDDDTGTLADNEFEIYGQRINGDSGTELGSDFRISSTGPDGNTGYQATNPDVVYNRTNNQYLVVWSGSDSPNKTEIWGRRINATTGALVGGDFLIGSMGPAPDSAYDAYQPSVAWNSANNQYFVVWSGDDVTRGTVDEEYEIFGQRVNADGSLFNITFRLSDLGPTLNAAYDAYVPDVAYSPSTNEYWVVWSGDDNSDGMVDEEFEIFVERFDAATLTLHGPNDYRLSEMGPTGNVAFDASEPQIDCSQTINQCVIAWHADHNTNGQLDNENEIFIERVGGLTPFSLTTYGQRRISLMGGLGNTALSGFSPHIAYNPITDDYLVAWYGTGIVNTFSQTEVFVQRIDGQFADQIGDEIAVSDMGPDSVDTLTAQSAAVAFNRADLEYLVVWHGDNNIAPLVNDELEVFCQRLGAADFFDTLLPLVLQ